MIGVIVDVEQVTKCCLQKCSSNSYTVIMFSVQREVTVQVTLRMTAYFFQRLLVPVGIGGRRYEY